MERIESEEVGLPVYILDLTEIPPPLVPGFYFTFQEPGADFIDQVGPYPTRDAALGAAGRVAHEAIREQATQALLHPDFFEEDAQ